MKGGTLHSAQLHARRMGDDRLTFQRAGDQTMNRRDFSKYVLTGGAALLGPRTTLDAAESAPAPQQNPADKFDLLIEGGTVIDPSQNINGAMDVAVREGKILEVSKSIA